MNIVLLGYRGCGKSTVGRLLAHGLGMDFIDVDEDVCRRFGRPHIAAVWGEYGQDVFRQMEAIAVVELIQQDGHVIALGGGSVIQEDARRALGQAEHMWRVYLRCEPEELLRRVRKDPTREATRANPEELSGSLEQIQQVLRVREPVYVALADHTVEVTGLTPGQAAERVLQRFAETMG